jgi:alanine dehydrogenase
VTLPLTIGVPREVKLGEHRVAITPDGVDEIVDHGSRVVIESGAGADSSITDDEYRAAGAEVLADVDAVWAEADLVCKVKEPQEEELGRLRPGLVLFTYLHLAAYPKVADALLANGVTGVAYETVQLPTGGLPLLAPMSEVAGRLSIEAAGMALKRFNGGRGLLLGGVPGVRPARLVVIGGGVVGTHAARMAVGLGAEVTILDRSLPRLRQLDEMFLGRVRTRFSAIETIEEEVFAADVVIGAVLVPGASAPKLVTRDMLKRMKRGAVVVDVAIDQGGCFETSRPTTHANPTYEVDGIIHYCVANMPGSVPLTSSHALNNATLPFGLALASGGVQAILRDPHLKAGLNVHKGMVTHPAVAESLGLPYRDPAEAIG